MVKIVFRGLAEGESRLGLPALAGLFAPEECPDLDAAKIENRAFLGALFHLGWLRESSGLVRVNWRDMGADELGYIYEGLLELVPQITGDGRSFSFAGADESRGHARKTTGSYYTPEELVQLLLASALDPVVKHAVSAHSDRAADALLELTIVDPACGSGHFLLAAARRLADHVARIRAGGTPTPDDYQRALRDGRPALHLRRRHEPAGRRALQGEPVDGVDRSGPAAHLPGKPHPLRQLAHRHEPRADGRPSAGRGLGGPRGRRQGGHCVAQAA